MYFTHSTTLAATAIFASLAAAQNSSTSSANPTINMFVNDAFNGDAAYAARIVSACADKTVYALQCTSAAYVGQATCGPNGPIATLTEGPDLYVFAITTSVVTAGVTVQGSMSESCALSGTTAASCFASVSVSAQGQHTETASSTVLTGTDYHRFNVEITEGAELTAAATATCAPDHNGAMAVNAREVLMFGSALAAGVVGMMLL